MKTYYLIRVWTRPSENNPLFPDGEAFYYYGKGGQLLAARGTREMISYLDCPKSCTDNDIRKYGYIRLCDARRIANQRSKRRDYYWNNNIVIIAEPVPD